MPVEGRDLRGIAARDFPPAVAVGRAPAGLGSSSAAVSLSDGPITALVSQLNVAIISCPSGQPRGCRLLNQPRGWPDGGTFFRGDHTTAHQGRNPPDEHLNPVLNGDLGQGPTLTG